MAPFQRRAISRTAAEIVAEPPPPAGRYVVSYVYRTVKRFQAGDVGYQITLRDPKTKKIIARFAMGNRPGQRRMPDLHHVSFTREEVMKDDDEQ